VGSSPTRFTNSPLVRAHWISTLSSALFFCFLVYNAGGHLITSDIDETGICHRAIQARGDSEDESSADGNAVLVKSTNGQLGFGKENDSFQIKFYTSSGVQAEFIY